jgi:hypothetical protein
LGEWFNPNLGGYKKDVDVRLGVVLFDSPDDQYRGKERSAPAIAEVATSDIERAREFGVKYASSRLEYTKTAT